MDKENDNEFKDLDGLIEYLRIMEENLSEHPFLFMPENYYYFRIHIMGL